MTMAGQLVGLAVGAALSAALLSNLSARLVIRSGARFLDVPGPRSSHQNPTPRGGGIGIAIVGVLSMAALAIVGIWPLPWLPTIAAFALVTIVGGLDDIRHQPVILRLAVHLSAAAMLLAASGVFSLQASPVHGGLSAVMLTLGLIWSINLHNFMDGIDGLLAAQTVWCAAVFAALFFLAGSPALALFALLLAAAAAGFLPLNFPRARVFLGDNASGYVGLALGWLAIYGAFHGAFGWPEVLVIGSAFIVDSGATLLWRAMRGERVWQAHRAHAYQCWVRRGYQHDRVTIGYMAWNLCVGLPAVILLRMTENATVRWGTSAAVVMLAVALWCIAPRQAADDRAEIALEQN